jgi:serine/threonine protein kinase
MAEVNEPLSEPSSETWAALQRLVSEFEDAWQGERPPAIDDFLPSGGEQRRLMLVELVHVDLERRLKAGESVRVETYLDRYPELAAERGVVLGLLAAEFRLRRRSEPELSLDEYRDRFPQHAPDFPAWFKGAATMLRGSTPATVNNEFSTETPCPGPGMPTPPPGRSDLPAVPGYLIHERIGEGGMGQVYLARHLHNGRSVALKVVRPDRLANPEAVRRFQREAKAAARLTHPHIVTIYDSGQAGDTHFLVMEYVEGIDLARLLKELGRLPVAEACDYVRQAALGLQHAHERGLVHRDIKPHNLLRGTDGTIKVLDMGLARLDQLSHPDSSASELTQTGTLMGTPAYVAPEQALDPRRADIRSDVYSLGCTLYHLLTGQPPFPRGSLAEILLKHQLTEPTAVEELRPEVPPRLGAVLRKLMAKRPQDRYQTPAEAAQALEPFSRADSPALALATAGPDAARVARYFPGAEVGTAYRLARRIGCGVFGVVWQAETADGEAAVKILLRSLRDPREAHRLSQALEQVRQLNHPFLLQLLAYWLENDHVCLAMELAEGNVRDRWKACRRAGLPGLPLYELVGFVREAAEALDYLHRAGVLHGNVKPDNLLVLSGHVKVADYHQACVCPPGAEVLDATIVGTPLYTAPEMWRGKVGPASDQYALALSYGELRLGRPLVAGRDLASAMLAHLEGHPDLSPLPEPEQEVLRRALAKDPVQRFRCCLDFAKALEDALEAPIQQSRAAAYFHAALPEGGSAPNLSGGVGVSPSAETVATLPGQTTDRPPRREVTGTPAGPAYTEITRPASPKGSERPKPSVPGSQAVARWVRAFLILLCLALIGLALLFFV